MSVIHATINNLEATYPGGHPAPVISPIPVAKETLDGSGSHDRSTITVASTAKGAQAWRISTDTACWVRFGVTPTASAGNDHYMAAGAVAEFAAVAGQKVSVIDA